MSRRGAALFVAMCLIWGVPYLLIKVAVGTLSPTSLVFWRTAIGAVLLVPVAAARGDLRPLRERWGWVVVYTAVEIGVPWLLLSDAERRLSSSLTGLLVATLPLIGAVLALLTGGDERLGVRRALGLVVGFVGVGVLLGFTVTTTEYGAVGEVLVVATCYAVGALLIGRRLSTLPGMGVVAASLALTALVYAPVALPRLPPTMPGVQVVASVAVLGVVCTALAFLLFFRLIAEIGPVRSTVIAYVNPAVAVALGVTVLGEPFAASTAAGFVLILAGSVVATSGRRREPGRVSAPLAEPIAEP